MKKVIHSLLIIFCIHYGSVFASGILEYFFFLFIGYPFIPFTKLLVLPFELLLIYKCVTKSFLVNEGEIKINNLLFFAATLILLYPFKEFIEPKLIVCGNSLFDPIEAKGIQESKELHYFYDGLVNKITYIIYAIFLAIAVLIKWKKG